MLTLCDDGHDEVCFEGSVCPACAILSDLEEANVEIKDLKEEIETLKLEASGD